MEMAVSAQWHSVALALLFGALSGVLYDLLRILRVLCGMHGSCPVPPPPARALPFLPNGFFEPKPRKKGTRAFYAVFVFLCDMLWLPTVGALFSVFVYWQNDGVFRLYMLCSAVVGFAVYYQTVGRLVLLTAETVAIILRIAFFYIFLLLSLPFRFLYTVGRKSMRFLYTVAVLPLSSAHRLRKRLHRTREGEGLFWQSI